jgi:hypothetical protein
LIFTSAEAVAETPDFADTVAAGPGGDSGEGIGVGTEVTVAAGVLSAQADEAMPVRVNIASIAPNRADLSLMDLPRYFKRLAE